MTFYLIEKIE